MLLLVDNLAMPQHIVGGVRGVSLMQDMHAYRYTPDCPHHALKRRPQVYHQDAM